MTEWLQHEFQDRSEVRIGANPKLVSAFIWEAWEDALGNDNLLIKETSSILFDIRII